MDTYSIFQYESIHFPINQKWNVDRIGFLMDTNYKSIPNLIISTELACSKFVEHEKNHLYFSKWHTIIINLLKTNLCQ